GADVGAVRRGVRRTVRPDGASAAGAPGPAPRLFDRQRADGVPGRALSVAGGGVSAVRTSASAVRAGVGVLRLPFDVGGGPRGWAGRVRGGEPAGEGVEGGGGGVRVAAPRGDGVRGAGRGAGPFAERCARVVQHARLGEALRAD